MEREKGNHAWDTDSLKESLCGISFPSIVSLLTSTLYEFASFYLSVVTWGQSLQCGWGDSNECGSLTLTLFWKHQMKNEQTKQPRNPKSVFSFSGDAKWTALPSIPLYVFWNKRCPNFSASDPFKLHSTEVELWEDLILEFEVSEEPGRLWVYPKKVPKLWPLITVKDSFPSTILLTTEFWPSSILVTVLSPLQITLHF